MTCIGNHPICLNCNEILPRFAAGQCPLCRAPIASAKAPRAVTWRRGNAALSPSGAKNRPSCQTRSLRGPQPGQRVEALS